MDKKLEDLMTSVFGSSKTRTSNKTDELIEAVTRNQKNLEKLKKNSEDSLTELEAFSKKLKEEAKVNSTFNQEVQSFNTTLKKDLKKINFLDIEKEITDSMIGQDDFIHRLIIAFKRPDLAGHITGNILNNILVLGNQGTGKNMIIQKLVTSLYNAGKLNSNKVNIVDFNLYQDSTSEKVFIQDIYMAISKEHTVTLFQNFENASPFYQNLFLELLETGKLQLKNRYILQNKQLVEANHTLSSNAIQTLEAKNIYCIAISNLSKSKIAQKMGQRFMDLFIDICESKPFNEEEIKQFIDLEWHNTKSSKLSKIQMNIHNEQLIKDYILNKYDESFGIDSIVYNFDKVVQALIELKLQSLSDDMIDVYVKENTSITFIYNEDEYTLESLLPNKSYGDIIDIQAELDDIVGLDNVKEYILSLKDHYEIQAVRKEMGYKVSTISKHMIFMGNPGTGKTTIARLIGKYLKAIGILKSGQLIEVSRADLVGRYVGHTAPLTKQVCESALGGILFIDEAYSLYRGKDDAFGLEAIDTLVKFMEDYKDDLIVILAGYNKEMNEFLESNSGLKSRFPNMVQFNDYTADELLKITLSISKGKDYVVLEECYEPLKAYYEHMQQTNSKQSGNGRMARNTLEQAILNQSKRLVKDKDAKVNELKLIDFEL